MVEEWSDSRNEAEVWWSRYKELCMGLRLAKKVQLKQKLQELKNFVSEKRVARRLEFWKAWPLSLNIVLDLAKAELDSFVSKKSTRKVYSQEIINSLTTLLGDSESIRSNLHSSDNGLSFLRRCLIHSLEVLENDQVPHEFYWLVVRILVKPSVYCRIVPESHLIKLLELSISKLGSGHSAIVQIVHALLKNTPYDINPQVFDGLVRWIELNWGRSEPLFYDALMLIDGITFVLKREGLSMSGILRQLGSRIVGCLVRGWATYGITKESTKFMIVYLNIAKMDSAFQLSGKTQPALEEMAKLHSHLLDPNLIYKYSGLVAVISYLDSPATYLEYHEGLNYMTLAADVVYHAGKWTSIIDRVSQSSSKDVVAWILLAVVYLLRYPKEAIVTGRMVERLVPLLSQSSYMGTRIHIWTLELMNTIAITTRLESPVWETVFRTLLRPDLPFTASTASCTVGSLGEAVLRLLGTLVYFQLVSIAVVDSEQQNLWVLPAFQSTQESPIVFHAIYCFLMSFDLKEGNDSIGSTYKPTRRGRILAYIAETLSNRIPSAYRCDETGASALYASVILAILHHVPANAPCTSMFLSPLAEGLHQDHEASEIEKCYMHGFGVEFFLQSWGSDPPLHQASQANRKCLVNRCQTDKADPNEPLFVYIERSIQDMYAKVSLERLKQSNVCPPSKSIRLEFEEQVWETLDQLLEDFGNAFSCNEDCSVTLSRTFEVAMVLGYLYQELRGKASKRKRDDTGSLQKLLEIAFRRLTNQISVILHNLKPGTALDRLHQLWCLIQLTGSNPAAKVLVRPLHSFLLQADRRISSTIASSSSSTSQSQLSDGETDTAETTTKGNGSDDDRVNLWVTRILAFIDPSERTFTVIDGSLDRFDYTSDFLLGICHLVIPFQRVIDKKFEYIQSLLTHIVEVQKYGQNRIARTQILRLPLPHEMLKKYLFSPKSYRKGRQVCLTISKDMDLVQNSFRDGDLYTRLAAAQVACQLLADMDSRAATVAIQEILKIFDEHMDDLTALIAFFLFAESLVPFRRWVLSIVVTYFGDHKWCPSLMKKLSSLLGYQSMHAFAAQMVPHAAKYALSQFEDGADSREADLRGLIHAAFQSDKSYVQQYSKLSPLLVSYDAIHGSTFFDEMGARVFPKAENSTAYLEHCLPDLTASMILLKLTGKRDSFKRIQAKLQKQEVDSADTQLILHCMCSMIAQGYLSEDIEQINVVDLQSVIALGDINVLELLLHLNSLFLSSCHPDTKRNSLRLFKQFVDEFLDSITSEAYLQYAVIFLTCRFMEHEATSDVWEFVCDRIKEPILELSTRLRQMCRLDSILTWIEKFDPQPLLNQTRIKQAEAFIAKYYSPGTQHVITKEELINLRKTIRVMHENNDFYFPGNSSGQRLIHILLQFSQRKYDNQVRMEAANCLGEIGGWDVSFGQSGSDYDVLYEHFFNRASLSKLQFETLLKDSYQQIFQMTVTYLYDNDVEVVSAAIDCLSQFQEIVEYQEIVDDKWTLEHLVACRYYFQVPSTTTGSRIDWKIDQLDSCDAEDWIKRLVSSLVGACEDPIYRLCHLLCRVKVEFALHLFPYVMFSLLNRNSNHDVLQTLFSEQVARVFDPRTNCQPRILQWMVHLMNFLREVSKQMFLQHNGVGYYHIALPSVPYKAIARAAIKCQMPASAIQYIEWQHDLHGEMKTDLLKEAYLELNDSNSIQAIQQSGETLMEVWQQNQRGSQVLCLTDSIMCQQMTSNRPIDDSRLANSLNRMDLHYTLHRYLSTTSNTDCLEAKYEQAWRLEDWNFIGSHDSSYPNHESIHQGLRLVESERLDAFVSFQNKAKLAVLDRFQLELSGMESTTTIRSSMLQLQTMVEMEDVMKLKCTGSKSMTGLYDIWSKRQYPSLDMRKSEPIQALESILLKRCDGGDSLIEQQHWLFCAERARKAGKHMLAASWIHRFEQLPSAQIRVGKAWELERASVLWGAGDTSNAIQAASKIAAENEPETFRAKLLTRVGKWAAEVHDESSQELLNRYFVPALQLIDSSTTQRRQLAKAHLALGNFLAELHGQVAARVNSSEWIAGRKVAELRVEELRQCENLSRLNQTRNRSHMHILRTELQNDMAERARVETSVMEFLVGALEAYGKSLLYSNRPDVPVVFRLIELWFENISNSQIQNTMQTVVSEVPSYKFVPLAHQIFSRMGPGIPKSLHILIQRLSSEHPYHSIPQLVSLKNGKRVDGRGAQQYACNIDQGKMQAAKGYLEEMKRRVGPIVEVTERMCQAYVDLAMFDTQALHGAASLTFPSSTFRLPSTGLPIDQLISRRSDVLPPLLTTEIRPNPSGNYDSIVRLKGFKPEVSLTPTGVHRPKIIYALGTDGVYRKQLVKGMDDTRQDAVIQQVFSIVNLLLRDNDLSIRTYRVVPLSPQAGVLEWVENTMSIGDYLVSRDRKRKGAHERYHPKEMPHRKCREALRVSTDKLKTFQMIMKNFTPVFHQFFNEKYPDAATWLARRQAYTKSVAVASMVGYIMGIGDRHAQNILIDAQTAELVHIDFGIVFDQGMALLTPETVPFRLTRDLVDAMGYCGTKGLFTKCCQDTMQVLRSNSSMLCTILGVLVHDPVYQWQISPLKILRLEAADDREATAGKSQEEETSAIAAERVLLRIKQKLQGYEDPNGTALGVEGHVRRLIKAAQDPRNLATLYPGWSPWL